MAEDNQNACTDRKEAMMNQHHLLPRPVRLFSYLFFGAVAVAGLIGWIVSLKP